LECGSNYTICQVVDYGTKGLIGNTFSNKNLRRSTQTNTQYNLGLHQRFIECCILLCVFPINPRIPGMVQLACILSHWPAILFWLRGLEKYVWTLLPASCAQKTAFRHKWSVNLRSRCAFLWLEPVLC